jgi:hypothetical protein
MRKPLVYLASPYSSADKSIIERRVSDVQAATAKLIEQGNLIFSPIVHSHPLSPLVSWSPVNTCTRPESATSEWMCYDKAFIDHCDELWVLMLDGWDTSRGVSDEIAYAYEHNIPVRFVSYPEISVSTYKYTAFNPYVAPSNPALPHIKASRLENKYDQADRSVSAEFTTRITNEEAERILNAIFGEDITPLGAKRNTSSKCDTAHGAGDFYSPPSSGKPPLPLEHIPEAKQTIIGLNGHAQVGKDTVGAHLVEKRGFTRIGLADAVREAAYALDPVVGLVGADLVDIMSATEFCELEGTVGEEGLVFFTRLAHLVDHIGWERAKKFAAVRTTLQKIGTEAGRDIHGRDCWLDIAEAKIEAAYPNPVVITDIRFPNEAEFVHDLGGVVVGIERLGITPVNGHTSEGELDAYLIDWCIYNEAGLIELRKKADVLVDFYTNEN